MCKYDDNKAKLRCNHHVHSCILIIMIICNKNDNLHRVRRNQWTSDCIYNGIRYLCNKTLILCVILQVFRRVCWHPHFLLLPGWAYNKTLPLLRLAIGSVPVTEYIEPLSRVCTRPSVNIVRRFSFRLSITTSAYSYMDVCVLGC